MENILQDNVFPRFATNRLSQKKTNLIHQKELKKPKKYCFFPYHFKKKKKETRGDIWCGS